MARLRPTLAYVQPKLPQTYGACGASCEMPQPAHFGLSSPMRYRLRTLLIVLTLGPPALAAIWFVGPATLLAPLLVVVLAAWSEI